MRTVSGGPNVITGVGDRRSLQGHGGGQGRRDPMSLAEFTENERPSPCIMSVP
jgi:hypothetical protein